mmetsp:Transcript_16217/g.27202  ORF Transcript_16217/g.27202 Transcript_16217/m.27202 type:complete len:403 (-) Transcript_16217:307-1515(-)
MMLTMTSFICKLWLILICLDGNHAVEEQSLVSARQPKAILHIGAPKTGTTYVQSVLASKEATKMMSEENMYWPMMPKQPLNAKGAADWAITTMSGRHFSKYSGLAHPKQEIDAFIRDSFDQKRDVIISAENLIAMPRGVALELRDSVFKGFDLTVVITYREWISHTLSLYFEKENGSKRKTGSKLLSSFLMNIMDEQPRDQKILKSIAEAMDVFGANHVKVIDYDGTLAIGKDIAYTLICEIGGVLCDKWNGILVQKRMNAIKSLEVDQLYSAFLHFIHVLDVRENCRVCPGRDEQLRNIFQHAYEESNSHPAVPLINTSLSLLVPYSNSIDAEFREQFGAITINGNVTANREIARSHIHTSELAVDEVWSSDAWMIWMTTLLDESRHQGALCCDTQSPKAT